MPKPKPRSQYAFEAIGTRWEIETTTALPDAVKRSVHDAADDFDRAYSRFRADSLVTRLASDGGSATFPEGADRIFSLYERLYAATDGKLTPLVGQLLSDLGYDAAYSLTPSENPRRPEAYPDVVTRDGNTLTLTRPALLDIGAAGKGALTDRIARIVRAFDDDCVVDASGDIAVGGRTVRIGLEHPDDPTIVIGHVDIVRASLCGSAVNRRAWGKGLHHIVDPSTGRPVNGITATWVIADDTLLADGLATALFFTDPNRLSGYFSFSYVIMHGDGSLAYSRDDRITLYD